MYFWRRFSRFLASQVLLNPTVTLRQCKACSLPTLSAPVNLSPSRWCLVCTTHTVPRTAPAAVGPLLLLLAGFTPVGATGMSHLVNPGCWHDRRENSRWLWCWLSKLQVTVYRYITSKSVHVKLLLVIFSSSYESEHQQATAS